VLAPHHPAADHAVPDGVAHAATVLRHPTHRSVRDLRRRAALACARDVPLGTGGAQIRRTSDPRRRPLMGHAPVETWIDRHGQPRHRLDGERADCHDRAGTERSHRASSINCSPASPDSTGRRDTAEQRIAAAVLAVGMPALASHRSAAHSGASSTDRRSRRRDRRRRRRRLPGFDDVVIHRPKDLERLSRSGAANIVCTNILRTCSISERSTVRRARCRRARHHPPARITLPRSSRS
jgi:hypothetical protein